MERLKRSFEAVMPALLLLLSGYRFGSFCPECFGAVLGNI